MVALGVTGHVHHAVARDWFAVLADQFSTTPITQGSLIRLIVRQGRRVSDAIRVLDSVRDHPRHEFWPDAVPFSASMLSRVTGHADVTDAYLVALTRHHGGRHGHVRRGTGGHVSRHRGPPADGLTGVGSGATLGRRMRVARPGRPGRGRGMTLDSGRLVIKSTEDQVYETLRREIVRTLEPGTPLRLSAIAERLGVSTMPVRAALLRLESEGLVRQVARKGAVVAPLELEDIEEIQAIRWGIEGLAARLGAERVAEEALATMRKHLDEDPRRCGGTRPGWIPHGHVRVRGRLLRGRRSTAAARDGAALPTRGPALCPVRDGIRCAHSRGRAERALLPFRRDPRRGRDRSGAIQRAIMNLYHRLAERMAPTT